MGGKFDIRRAYGPSVEQAFERAKRYAREEEFDDTGGREHWEHDPYWGTMAPAAEFEIVETFSVTDNGKDRGEELWEVIDRIEQSGEHYDVMHKWGPTVGVVCASNIGECDPARSDEWVFFGWFAS